MIGEVIGGTEREGEVLGRTEWEGEVIGRTEREGEVIGGTEQDGEVRRRTGSRLVEDIEGDVGGERRRGNY